MIKGSIMSQFMRRLKACNFLQALMPSEVKAYFKRCERHEARKMFSFTSGVEGQRHSLVLGFTRANNRCNMCDIQHTFERLLRETLFMGIGTPWPPGGFQN